MITNPRKTIRNILNIGGPAKQLDLRRITFPIGCVLAVVFGDVSWWVILLVASGCCPLYITY